MRQAAACLNALGMLPVIVPVIFASCSSPRDETRHAIGDDYVIWRDEPHARFVVQRSGDTTDADGILDGAVVRIGWNDRYIWAERVLPAGLPGSGWMVVDRDRSLLLGPFSSDEMRRRASDLCSCPALVVVSIADAFARGIQSEPGSSTAPFTMNP